MVPNKTCPFHVYLTAKGCWRERTTVAKVTDPHRVEPEALAACHGASLLHERGLPYESDHPFSLCPESPGCDHQKTRTFSPRSSSLPEHIAPSPICEQACVLGSGEAGKN